MVQRFTILCILFFLTGCAHVISKDIRAGAVQDVSFSTVRADPDTYSGKTFIWGGFIAAVRSTKEGTFLEVVQNPLDSYGSIVDTDISEGRFLARSETDMDPLIYEKGRLVTIAGEFSGIKTVTRRKKEISYPVLEMKELHLWKDEPVLYPYTWYDPFYYGYPYYFRGPWPYYPLPPYPYPY